MTRDKKLAWIAVGIAVLLLVFASNTVSRLRATQAALEESQSTASTTAATLVVSEAARKGLQRALASTQEALAQERTANESTPSCVRVDVAAAVWSGEALLVVGETALCASKAGKLVWVNKVYGPRFNEEDSLAEAWNEASRWRDCAESLMFCPEGFVRSK